LSNAEKAPASQGLDALHPPSEQTLEQPFITWPQQSSRPLQEFIRQTSCSSESACFVACVILASKHPG